MANDLLPLLSIVIEIAKKAGQKIVPYFQHHEQLERQRKEDNTFVTVADFAANDILIQELQRLTPALPILSEESRMPDFETRKKWQRYWLLDPLDGTRGFINGSPEFTVNIALIENNQPVLGVIFSPILELLYFASSGNGAFRKVADQTAVSITTKELNWDAFQVLIGHYHHSSRLVSFIEQFKEVEIIRLNSSIKFCYLADGQGDIYPRYGPTSEWDTAAGQCILEEAGGLVVDLQGQPLHYNAQDSLINPAFVAVGDPSQIKKVLNVLPKPKTAVRR